MYYLYKKDRNGSHKLLQVPEAKAGVVDPMNQDLKNHLRGDVKTRPPLPRNRFRTTPDNKKGHFHSKSFLPPHP